MKTFQSGLISVIALLLSASVFAQNPRPAHCPGLSQIKAGGFSYIDYDASTHFASGAQESNYSTPQQWGFVIGQIYANSYQDAPKKLKAAVHALNTHPTPFYDSEDDLWVCLYKNDSKGVAVALEPLPPFYQSSMMLKHFA